MWVKYLSSQQLKNYLMFRDFTFGAEPHHNQQMALLQNSQSFGNVLKPMQFALRCKSKQFPWKCLKMWYIWCFDLAVSNWTVPNYYSCWHCSTIGTNIYSFWAIHFLCYLRISLWSLLCEKTLRFSSHPVAMKTALSTWLCVYHFFFNGVLGAPMVVPLEFFLVTSGRAYTS